MKTVLELIGYLDQQAAIRRQELTTLSASVTQQKGANQRLLARLAMTGAYAHFEGFVVDSGRKYIEHIALQGNSFVRLKDGLKVNALHCKLRALEKTDRVWLFMEVVEVLQGKKSAKVDPSVVDAQSNLKFDIFRDILICCGLDPKPYEARAMYIDNTLLAARNRIAHGSLEPVTEQDAVAACQFARQVIDEVNVSIANAAQLRAYLN